MGRDLQQTRHQHKWLGDTDAPHRYRLRNGAFTFETWKEFGIAGI